MRSGIRKSLDNIYEKVEASYRSMQTKRDAKHYLKMMGNVSAELKESYETQVLPYWKKYRMKPPLYWFQLFSQDGRHTDARYIPEDLWFGKILPYYSNMSFRRSYEDKCMHHILFPELKRPRTIVKNMAGQYYTDDLEPLTEQEALGLCMAEERFILKPSIDSGAGTGIRFYERGADSGTEIRRMIDSLKNNFIIQEIVEQHEILASFHKKSLNTIRILSFFFEGEVHVLSAIVRMGGGEARVDNVTSGGMQCGLQMDGQCHSLACTKKRNWVDRSPDGTVFAGTKIPAFDKILQIVIKEHIRFPHFRLIGWDFSVDREGEPVFIEYNVCPGANQMTCGPTFGDLTERVLEDVLIKKTLAHAKN